MSAGSARSKRDTKAKAGARAIAGLGAAGVMVMGIGIAPAASAVTVTTAANVGLYGAQDPTYDGVYRQSLAIIGLVAAGQTPDASAVSWLLNQQCANGSFTAYRANPALACTTASEDENATAAAIQALVALGKPTASAVTALRTFQLADGGFYDNTAFGPAASDVNSTGLALSALVAAGVDPSTVTSGGKSGSDYLRSLQLSCAASAGAGAYDYQTEATLHANDFATVQGLLGELGKALPVATTTPSSAVPACPTTVTDAPSSAAAATNYVATRLTATNGAIPSGFSSGTDWTTTANAVLDLDAADAGSAAVALGLAALEANVNAYAQAAGVYTPGALGTLLLVAHATGTDPTAFGGVNLVSALAGTERTAAAVPVPTTSGAPTLPATGAAGLLPMGGAGLVLSGLGIAALVASRRSRGTRQARAL
jgi:hypothetical protein